MADQKPHAGGPAPTAKDKILESGAAMTQNFAPIKNICAHLNAFHVYASDTSRHVEANHYCSHLSSNLRQCVIYDNSTSPARLIGVEYLITRAVYETLPAEERKLWHSHDYEVRSGLLVMPNRSVPEPAWNLAETEEMKEIVGTYGKTYHLWQVDRGDEIPLGEPQLMMSYTADDQVPWDKVKERDQRYNVDYKQKKEARQDIKGTQVHQDADSCWK